MGSLNFGGTDLAVGTSGNLGPRGQGAQLSVNVQSAPEPTAPYAKRESAASRLFGHRLGLYFVDPTTGQVFGCFVGRTEVRGWILGIPRGSAFEPINLMDMAFKPRGLPEFVFLAIAGRSKKPWWCPTSVWKGRTERSVNIFRLGRIVRELRLRDNHPTVREVAVAFMKIRRVWIRDAAMGRQPSTAIAVR